MSAAKRFRIRFSIQLATLCLVWMPSEVVRGQLQLPAIDPSGQRILLPAPNYTTLNSNVDPATGRRQHPLLDHLLHRNRGQAAQTGQAGRQGLLHHQTAPAFTTPAIPPDCPEGLMPNTAGPGPSEIVPSNSVAPRVLVPGTCQDPATAAQDATKTFLGHTKQPSHPQAIVTLSPARQIAPVGSEVVLIGGICDGTGYYQVRAPVEWTIAQGSVGNFVDPGRAFVGHSPLRSHLGTFFAEPLPELLSNNYAVGETSRKVQVLTRGTTETNDDLIVESGQTWIGLSSPLEGTTHVTLMAPFLDGWTQRTQTAVVHWIDGQWTFPRPAIVQGIQPYTLTTTVQRKVTTGAIFGWIVRYEILDATATFEGGSTTRDVLTDSTGAASIQIQPVVPTGGSAQVRIQIIRPAGGGERDPLVLGEGTTRVTWTTSLVAVDITGPESVKLNESPNYRITVSNPGTLAASNVRVQVMIPTGFQVLSAAPIGQQVGSRLDWALAQLRPGEEQVFDISYRASQSGTARHCVNVQAEGGSPIEDCLTTDVTMDALEVRVLSGPNPEIPLRVNQNVEYQITIANRGDRALTDVMLTDRFDAGLAHELGVGPIDLPIGRLEVGESRQVGLAFRIAQEGRHCHTVEATATGTPPAKASACVTALPAARTDLSVTKGGPSQMTEGSREVFSVELVNTGDVPLTNLQVTDQFGPEFRVIMADPPASRIEGNRVVWYLTRLAPGERRMFQVTCQAMFGNIDSASTEVIVQTADGLRRSDQKSLRLLPAAGGGTTPSASDPGLPLPQTGGAASPNSSFPSGGTNVAPRGAAPLPGYSPSPSSASSTPPGGLGSTSGPIELTLSSTQSAWNVGDHIDYSISIRNNQNAVDANVILTVYLPQQLQLETYSGPVNAADHSDDWRTFRMVPIQTLRPGEIVAFTVRVKVAQTGQLVVRADVRSAALPDGVAREHVSTAST